MSCTEGNTVSESRTVDHYFEQLAELELAEMLLQEIMIDSKTLSNEFKDSNTGKMNVEGYTKYFEIKKDIYLSFFKDYLFLQKIEFDDDIYALYFTISGFEDMQWNVFKWKKDNWKGEERLNENYVEENSFVEKIFWNYDEATKNRDNVRIFIENDFLVMERSSLYHSLYDLKSYKVVVNEESPWHASGGKKEFELKEWIRINLHNRIEDVLKLRRQ